METLPRTSGVVMRFGPVQRGLCVALLAGVLAVGAFVWLRYRGSDAEVIEAFLAFAALLLGAGTVEVLGVAHRLVPGGIERVAPGRRRTLVRWTDVVAIDWIPTARWYELRSRQGVRVRVYQQLGGLPSFARAALEGVPPPVLDARPGLRRQLEDASRGVAPPEVDRSEWRSS